MSWSKNQRRWWQSSTFSYLFTHQDIEGSQKKSLTLPLFVCYGFVVKQSMQLSCSVGLLRVFSIFSLYHSHDGSVSVFYVYSLLAEFNLGLVEDCHHLNVYTDMCPHVANSGLCLILQLKQSHCHPHQPYLTARKQPCS
jgi:hypothetical protein